MKDNRPAPVSTGSSNQLPSVTMPTGLIRTNAEESQRRKDELATYLDETGLLLDSR